MTAVRRLCQILALLTNVKRSPRYNNNTFGQMQLYTNREENTKIEIPIHTCLLCLYLAFCVIIEILWQPFLHWHCMTLTVTDRHIVVCISLPELVWCFLMSMVCCDACQRLRTSSAAAAVAARPWRENPAIITQNRLTVCTSVTGRTSLHFPDFMWHTRSKIVSFATVIPAIEMCKIYDTHNCSTVSIFLSDR